MIITSSRSSRITRSSTSTDDQIDESAIVTAEDGRRSRMEMLRTSAVVLIALLLGTHAMYVAASVLIPVVAAVVIALALRPIVRRLKHYGLPEPAAAFGTLTAAALLTVFLTTQLVTPASEWVARTPIKFKLRQLERKLEPLQAPLQSVHEASDEITKAVDKSTGADDSDPDTPQAVVVKPPSLISEVINSTWQFTAGTLLCLVLTFFFLAKGETLIERVANIMPIRVSGPSEDCGVAAVERSVSRYLLTVSAINACLGASVGIACWLIGVPNAMLWGVMAALLNFLPYIGGLVGAGIVLLVSLFTFDSMAYTCIAPAAYLLLTTIEGNFVTPAVLGRSMSLNPLIVILSLTYWTWLWGAAGAILAVPLLAIFVAACRQFEGTRPLAAMLSD
jgi:predicted PurR-regulated permease PerM